MMSETVIVDYTNHRQVRLERVIKPMSTLWYGVSEFHPLEQWFMRVYDPERKVLRDLALLDIHGFRSTVPKTSFETSLEGIVRVKLNVFKDMVLGANVPGQSPEEEDGVLDLDKINKLFEASASAPHGQGILAFARGIERVVEARYKK